MSRAIAGTPTTCAAEPRGADAVGEMKFPAWLAALAIAALAGCSTLPVREATESTAIAPAADTPIGRAVTARLKQAGGLSAIYPLLDGLSAFAARAVLAKAATRSLDVQYYIWHADLSGVMLMEVLREAAERGVRVRLLLDDNGSAGLDPLLVVLDAHPNIEVRLFNPFASRSFRALGYLTDFSRLNRRMHNKSFTADNQATIVGGRNVGDEYFAAGEDVWFADLDVLAAGPVAQEVSAWFDRYWNSESAFPLGNLVREEPAQAQAAWAAQIERVRADPQAARYVAAVRDSETVRRLLDGSLPVEWAPARVVADDPRKILVSPDDESVLMMPRLFKALGTPRRELQLVSPYFVPGEGGAAGLARLAGSGVKVQILTNSLAATDVTAVHAGYMKRRQTLVDGGVALFELRAQSETIDRKLLAGSSGASLHAKTFGVDRERIFVGSFNLDPRSARLNTEMGVVIGSPKLAGQLADAFARAIPALAYEVRAAAESGGLQWREMTATGERVYDTDPATSGWRRFGVQLLSILPIEWLL
jgi:putative cardiolipin synthase